MGLVGDGRINMPPGPCRIVKEGVIIQAHHEFV